MDLWRQTEPFRFIWERYSNYSHGWVMGMFAQIEVHILHILLVNKNVSHFLWSNKKTKETFKFLFLIWRKIVNNGEKCHGELPFFVRKFLHFSPFPHFSPIGLLMSSFHLLRGSIHIESPWLVDFKMVDIILLEY